MPCRRRQRRCIRVDRDCGRKRSRRVVQRARMWSVLGITPRRHGQRCHHPLGRGPGGVLDGSASTKQKDRHSKAPVVRTLRTRAYPFAAIWDEIRQQSNAPSYTVRNAGCRVAAPAGARRASASEWMAHSPFALPLIPRSDVAPHSNAWSPPARQSMRARTRSVAARSVAILSQV